MPILVDSSFLYSLVDHDDKNFDAARKFITDNREPLVIPAITLVEITHVLKQRFGQHTVVEFLRLILELQSPLEQIALADVERAVTIMEQYTDARFDFVDCCIMALAERLNITRVCTFDRRDFSIFRPSHCDYLQLLP